MPEQPPQPLVDLLTRLGLSTASAIERMRGRMRRLARDLPVFESVWVDALAQARVITPYQATEINAGRGERLAVGPYVLLRPLISEGYGRLFSAKEIVSGRRVRLLTVSASPEAAGEIRSKLEQLVVSSRQVESPHVATVDACGIDCDQNGDRIWAECRDVDGVTAAEALTRHGRMPAAAALEIARQMSAALADTEAAGVLHGDVSAAGLIISPAGLAQMPMPGLRPILRPEEGYAYADLQPTAYDGLAPERAADGQPPSGAADVYACGCLWWQLLVGRPPFSGGNSLTKLRNVLSARLPSLRRLAPDAPALLIEVIEECLRRDPNDRPVSFQVLQTRLGPASRSGKRALRSYLAGRGGGLVRRGASRRARGRQSGRRSWAGPALIAMILLALATWPLWRRALDGENTAPPLATTTAGAPADDPQSSSASQEDRATPRNPLVQASFNAVDDSSNPRPTRVLATDRTHRLDELDLPPRCIVRGASGGRPQINVPRMGLSITAEDVRFENVDFVWDHPATSSSSNGQRGALVYLLADSAEFRGCSFQATKAAATRPVAVLWQSGAGRDPQQSLITGQVKLVDCVLAGVDDGLDCHYAGALHVAVTNTLFLGTGALVALDHFPRSDEPVVVAMSQTTIRGGSALGCRYRAADKSVGRISIVAGGCVFAPADGTSLLRLRGEGSPDGLLRSIQWSGDGALITPSAPLAAWSNADGKSKAIDTASLEIDGLVRSRVQFVGPAGDVPGGSGAVRWQAPLRSIDPPGIDARRLRCPAP
ncbi:MAG: protein kinase [Planctomycetes bacterium]|nr:protein kinase [Planctomycetota bacterium]